MRQSSSPLTGAVSSANANAHGSVLAFKSPADSSQDASAGDWGKMLNAVKAKLSVTVNGRHATDTEPQGRFVERRDQAAVVACLEALDELHAKLMNELDRRQQLEREIADAQNELTQTRAELVGTQADVKRAQHLALHDCLTALPNRSFFRERLDHALAQSGTTRQTFAVLYLDLDNFKPINDAYGHGAGDELLRIVAARLRRAVRAEDLVSRMGGDEFACVLGGLPGHEQLCLMACKLLDAVSAPLYIGNLALSVRPSIGIAICPTDGASAELLLNNADAAMYRAKRQKIGYAFFDERADMRT